MTKYQTARGKVIDMSILASKNEKTRAVGNMRVNARGDTIDSTGKVIKAATIKVNEVYEKTVGNRAAQPVAVKARRVGNDPIAPIPDLQATSAPASSTVTSMPPLKEVNQQIDEPVIEELTVDEQELEDDLDLDEEVQEIKANEIKNGK